MKKVLLFVICILALCPVLGVYAASDGYLVKFKAGFCPDAYEIKLEEVYAQRGIYKVDNLEALKPVENYVEYTSVNKEVSLIEGEEMQYPVFLQSVAPDAEYEQIKLINADASWKLETYGNEIKVGVIDSGCIAHEELKNNLLEGKNYLTGSTDVTDINGHGTHVSGIIAAELNGLGVAGVAPKAKIVPLKCFDPGVSTYANMLLGAFYDAVDVYGCRVINMSWGLPGDDPMLKEAIDYAAGKGVILIASVGNDGRKANPTRLYYPAAYSNVIGVTSVGTNKIKSAFSQYNNSVTVAAMGEEVKSTYNDGTYAWINGTSQAAPMVSGVAAVALSMDETLTSAEFRQLLIETAEDLGDPGYDTKYGYGLTNEAALISRIMERMNYYVSPVNVKDGEATVLIKNNTGNTFSATSIIAGFNGNGFNRLSPKQVVLGEGESTTVKTEVNNDSVVHFLWNGLSDLSPVAKKREYNR